MNATPASRRQGSLDAAVLCFYGTDPASRPQCTLTAVTRLGPVALCADCLSRRSTLGKGQRARPLPPGPDIDILEWVHTAQKQAAAAAATLAAAVTPARQTGHPWTAIGSRLGITRQAAHQRFSRPTPTPATRAFSGEATKTPTRAN